MKESEEKWRKVKESEEKKGKEEAKGKESLLSSTLTILNVFAYKVVQVKFKSYNSIPE